MGLLSWLFKKKKVELYVFFLPQTKFIWEVRDWFLNNNIKRGGVKHIDRREADRLFKPGDNDNPIRLGNFYALKRGEREVYKIFLYRKDINRENMETLYQLIKKFQPREDKEQMDNRWIEKILKK